MSEPIRTREAITSAALEPHHSVVVEACAGSGKTWLLVARILRLLLAGAEPASILAITFTRKGAEEMNARLMQLLETLAGASDDEARKILLDRAVRESEIDALLPKARALFAEVAFASPGITISTFHGWFQQLLAAAPLGYGIGDSSIADSETRLLDEAWLSFAEALNRNAETPAALALQRLFAERGLSNARKLLADFIACRVEWHLYVRDTLQLAPDATNEQIVAAAAERWAEEWGVDPERDPVLDWRASAHSEAECRHLVQALLKLEKLPRTARERMEALAGAWELGTAGDSFYAAWRALITLSGTPVVLIGTWAGKAGLADVHQRICDALLAVDEARLARRNLDMNRDILCAGLELLTAYEKSKTDQRQLDYTDLEWRAFDLLVNDVHAETLQYRLDCRYRHLLLDEFQDTSPIQWRCLTSWLDASAAADNRPSVFMVGDPKQAIYRFRRTDARLFGIAREYFRTHYDAHDCRLDLTRRNAPPVTAFVNSLFMGLPDYQGFHEHVSEQTGMSGAAMVLPPFARPAVAPAQENIEWRNALETPLEDEVEQRYAEEAHALADGIRRAVGRLAIEYRDDAGHWQQRPARYRDFLVLFRRRAPLPVFEEALRAANVPYLSARSGGLIETLEVRDMVALLTFLSTPDADLALAQVLKSPLFAASDDDLLTLRFAEGGGAWWQRLQAMTFDAEDRSALALAQSRLRNWQRWLDTLPVHDLLDRIFHDADVISRYAAAVPDAMRAAVVANLHAFMALALQLDGGRYPSLARFLDELKSYRALPDQDAPDLGEVRELGEPGSEKDNEARPDAVRMMTIHMAKGLEAPVVWLIDTADASVRHDHHHAVVDWRPDESAPRHFSFVADAATRGRARQEIFEEEARYHARERRNLLYVAATRARQVFIMSGTEPAKSGPESWMDWARAHAADTTELWPQFPASDGRSDAPEIASDATPTVWNTPIGVRRPIDLDREARLHGIEIHQALERLAPVGRAGKFRTLAQAPDTPALQEAVRLVALPALQRFFRAGEFVAAGNEVEIAGAEGVARIDRLVEFADEVWVLDYKSGEVDVAENRAQVAGYCRLVAGLYPKHKVRGALVGLDGSLITVV